MSGEHNLSGFTRKLSRRISLIVDQYEALSTKQKDDSSKEETKKRKRAPSLKRSHTEAREHKKRKVSRKAEEENDRAREEKRNEARREILTTEKSYVNSLNTLISSYLFPLRESRILNEAEIDVIFSHVESIKNFNQEFLEALENRMKNWTSKTLLADIFLTYIPFFKMYTQYCYNYTKAITNLAQYKEKNTKFRSFLRKVEVTTMRLMDLLIMPVQRIPRYVMLLEQLVKYTLEHHPDYQPLLSAVKETQRATEAINEALREEQNKYSVISVLERFDDSLDLLDMHLIQPHRKLIREGVLLSAESDEDFLATEDDELFDQEPEEKGRYYVFLFNDLLLISTSIGVGSKKLLTVESHFNIVHTWIKDSNAGPEYMQIISPGGNITLKAESAEIRNKWTEDINAAIAALCKDDHFAKARKDGSLSYEEATDSWTVEINAPVLTSEVWDLPAEEYRAKVVENTEKALTDLLFHYGEQFQKKNYTPRKAVNVKERRGSFFQLFKDKFTPQKSKRRGDDLLPSTQNSFVVPANVELQMPAVPSYIEKLNKNCSAFAVLSLQLDYLRTELTEIKRSRSRASSFSSVTLRRSTREESDPWEEFRQLEQQIDFGGSPKAMKKMASSPTIMGSKITSPLKERIGSFDMSSDSCQQLGTRVNLAAKFDTVEKENSPQNSPQKSPVKEFKAPSHVSSSRRKSSVALTSTSTISSPRDKSRRKSIVTPIPSKVVSVRSKESSRQRRMSLVLQ
eukprot:TRINITY_DN5853_c0_g1_i1.p1 TRINITY_DN5853_c0_g1~~TRINITY_DN5853_c0_g1_i1.p1  ORF type:complete len:741 (-),score=186.63 TRINITY_DN5853_c0_g1_i1:99-2321(-)